MNKNMDKNAKPKEDGFIMHHDAGGISGPWINHYYNRVQYVGFNLDTVVQIQNIIYLSTFYIDPIMHC